MSFQYEQNLWNKIDLLHERYTRHHTYMIHLIEVLSKYHQACFEFSKTIKNILSKNYSMYDDTPSTFNNSMKSFIKTLSTHSQLFLQTSESAEDGSGGVLLYSHHVFVSGSGVPPAVFPAQIK